MKKGFTLIELIVVITIIGIVTAAVLANIVCDEENGNCGYKFEQSTHRRS